MHEVHPKTLWIANALEIRDRATLIDHGVAAAVDLAYEEPVAELPRQLVYCRFPLVDGEGNDPGVMQQAVRTTVDLLNRKMRTVVACSAGMSRSPAIAAAALAVWLHERPEDVLRRISQQKPLDVSPPFWADVLTALRGS